MIEALQELLNASKTDLTVNGKCTGCGECCSNILPLSHEELDRIKAYVKKHDIKPISHIAPLADNILDMVCPFCDLTKEKKCTIYNIRPEVCKVFICSKTGKDALKDILSNKVLQDAEPVLMRQMIWEE
jgi:Fe-S-cluster containining protein